MTTNHLGASDLRTVAHIVERGLRTDVSELFEDTDVSVMSEE